MLKAAKQYELYCIDCEISYFEDCCWFLRRNSCFSRNSRPSKKTPQIQGIPGLRTLYRTFNLIVSSCRNILPKKTGNLKMLETQNLQIVNMYGSETLYQKYWFVLTLYYKLLLDIVSIVVGQAFKLNTVFCTKQNFSMATVKYNPFYIFLQGTKK